MWLVLCNAYDQVALWAYEGLRNHGLAAVELITDAMLVRCNWEHRLSTDDTAVRLTLADGRAIVGEQVHGTLNRLLTIPQASLLLARPADRDYATQELTAFYVSWLHALPGQMLNRPTANGLSGAWRRASEWVWLAAQAGLPTPFYRQASHDLLDETKTERRIAPQSAPAHTIIVVAGQAIGPTAPAEILRGCERLSALVETALLGVEFAQSPGGAWTFTGATSWPDLRLGGQPLLDHLATVLADGRGRGA